MVKEIQVQLNSFIRGDTKRNWISDDLLYTSKDKGGLGFFNLPDFIDAIKITWIQRNGMGTKDHWCDFMDFQLNLAEWDRKKVWRMGDLCFKNLMPNSSA